MKRGTFMPENVRIGVIGTGWWASEYHIPGVLAHPQAELVAICDLDETRLVKTAQAYQLHNTYSDYRAMLARERLDGVVIATPHATHYAIARDCLEHNLHLLIEKPMTLYARDARELVEMAAARSREIMIGYTWNEYAHVQHARQAFLSGAMGQVQYVNSSFSSNVTYFLSGKVRPDYSTAPFSVHGPSDYYNRPEMMGGGQGHLQLTHSIGLMLYVTGLRPLQVQALMNNHGHAVDLVDAFSVAFEGGALGVIGGTGNAGDNYRMALSVYATGGCYIADSLAKFATLRKQGGQAESFAWELGTQDEFAVTRNFIDVIQGQPVNHAPGETGWRVVELLDAAYRSAREGGRPVSIQALYE
jgi:predicted dehydrogenase